MSAPGAGHPPAGARAGGERRLHLTASTRFLDKVAAARDGLSHALPAATIEQVLEAALDHVVPRALGGPTTPGNLRCACALHNRRAAEEVLGHAVAGVRRRSRGVRGTRGHGRPGQR